MKTALITGANRGLGLGFVKHLLKYNKVENIFATCRRKSEELSALSKDNKNLHILHLDVTDLKQIDDIALQVKGVTGDKGLNLLINNAGVSTKFTKLALVKAEHLLQNLTVNTIAPIMLTKALLPLLKQASEANSDKPMGSERAAVVNMSSILGSMAENDKGGFYPYRCSKAALNAATKSMSIDMKRDQIIIISMHPGWVKTEMGGSSAPLEVDTSVSGMLETIQNLREEHNGKFLQYNGSELSW